MAPDERAAAAAEALARQQNEKRPFAPLPPDLAPADLAAAYAVQSELHRLRAPAFGAVKGWKIALTTPVMQQMVGLDHPCEGAILARRIWRDPARVRAADHVHLGAEAEIAVLLDRSLGAEGAPHDRASVAGAVQSCMAAIELVDDRNAHYGRITAAELIADNAMNAGCVLGEPVPSWQGLDLAALKGRMLVNGEVVGEGVGADALGHPLDALAWLANSLAARGLGLNPGDVVLTGSVVRTAWLKAGDHVAVEIEDLGQARVSVL